MTALRMKDLIGLDADLALLRADHDAVSAEFPPLSPPIVTAMPDGGAVLNLDDGTPIVFLPYPIIDFEDGDFHKPPLSFLERTLLAAQPQGEVVSVGVVSAPRLSWFYTNQLPDWAMNDAALYSALSHFGVSLTRDGDGLRLTVDQEAWS